MATSAALGLAMYDRHLATVRREKVNGKVVQGGHNAFYPLVLGSAEPGAPRISKNGIRSPRP